MSEVEQRILASAAYRIRANAPPQLLAATADWDEARKHLRLNYFFDCRTDEVDFEELELGVGETVGDEWFSIETAGTAFIFDKFAITEALNSPSLVFTR